MLRANFILYTFPCDDAKYISPFSALNKEENCKLSKISYLYKRVEGSTVPGKVSAF